jgi:hypothetical protein
MLCKITGALEGLEFPNLARPSVAHDATPTQELINWGTKVYVFSWICQLRMLIRGMLLTGEIRNFPSVRVLARFVFELCAHIYYVDKHLRQHLEKKDLDSAWSFLLPAATGSRYMSQQFPEDSDLFPTSAHISKVINCFSEVFPDSADDYSYLSEYSHPNMAAFKQHYEFLNPQEVVFHKQGTDAAPVFGSTVAVVLNSLFVLRSILGIADEMEIRAKITVLMREIASEASSA